MKYAVAAGKMLLGGLCALSLALPACTGASAQNSYKSGHDYDIRPPFDADLIRARDGVRDIKSYRCGEVPPPLHDLQFESIYGDLSQNRSIIDPDAYEAYIDGIAPISQYQKELTGMANRYLRSVPPRPDIASCALAWLDEWARSNALLGDANHTGEAVRKWVLAPIALSYVQIRDQPDLDPRAVKRVESWIRHVSKAVVADYKTDTEKNSRRNNHLYWAAWGVASAAVALDDASLFDWAMKRARFGIAQIRPDGTLPLELVRGRMALNYHVFALNPLIMLAVLGQRNGVDLYAENNGALDRLAQRTLDGLADPRYFEELTGEEQDTGRVYTDSQLGWMEPYSTRSDHPQISLWLDRLRPLRQARFGGDMSLLYTP